MEFVTREEVLRSLRSLADPNAVRGMARYEITPKKTYRVSVPDLKNLARRIGKHPAVQFRKDSLRKEFKYCRMD